MTASSQAVNTADTKITNTKCDYNKTMGSIGIALGIIIALGGILAFIAVAYPNALGPFNALSQLTYFGAAVLVAAGITVTALALAYICKKQSISETTKMISETTKTEAAHVIADIRQKLTEENISELPARDSIVSYLHKYCQNSDAVTYLISEIMKLPYAVEIVMFLFEDTYELDGKALDDKCCKSIVILIADMLRAKPPLFKKFIENNAPTTQNPSMVWFFLSDMTTKEVNDLISREYAVYKNDMVLIDSFNIIPNMKNINMLFCLICSFNHKEEVSDKTVRGCVDSWTTAKVQKMYNSLIQNFPKIKTNDGKIISIELALRSMVIENKNNADMNVQQFMGWIKQDFKQYFPAEWENTFA